MLRLLNIFKEYKVDQESILALKDVSIEFRKNEFVSILGPSGCGKTTLLNIIGGLDRYTSGDIQVDGVSTKQYDDVDWDTYRNRKIGFVFQSYNLIPHMNILKNVAMSLTLAGVEREERRRRALEALEKVGLASQAGKKPNQLSGGQMQRVAIARALVNNPEIILADEPTGALDSESGIQVMDLLKEVAEDRLVIMVTHNPTLAEQYSTRIVYLKDGAVEGDTMPYDSNAEREAEEAPLLLDEEDEVVKAEAETVETEMIAEETPEVEKSEAPEAATLEENASEAEAVEEEATEAVKVEMLEGEEQIAQETPEQQQLARKKAAQKKESKFDRFVAKLKAKMAKYRKADKSAMKLGTAINLSWNNLISKKGRTILTSIAGSIGIIGIILVLSLSNGASIYINTLEESALSNYPISVNQNSMDIESVLTTLMSAMNVKPDKVSDDTITVQEVLGNAITEFLESASSGENDLHALKQYVDANFDDSLATVRYGYGVNFNAYVRDKKDQSIYMKINPYTETMAKVIDDVFTGDLSVFKDMKLNLFGQEMTFEQAIGYMANMMSGGAWSELSSNQKLLNDQYELVGKRSRWPQSENEVVIVVDQYNRLIDYQLFMLGLQSQSEVMNAIGNGDVFSAKEYDLEEVLGLRYKVMMGVDYLEEDPAAPGTYVMHPRTEQDVDTIDKLSKIEFSDGTNELRVSGVVRPKPGAVATSITGLIGYSPKLTPYLMQYVLKHPAVQKMMQLYEDGYEDGNYRSVITYYSNPDGSGQPMVSVGDEIDTVDKEKQNSHVSVLRALGYADVDYPQVIEFYCSSFDSKAGVEKFIADYNALPENKENKEKQIKYSDSLSSMMTFIDTMVTTITGVLIAFAAISLIVSTIMIAIIIYTSVLERRKEIGVLRSIGARKKDISRVFIAESAILGGYSGVIGVGVAAIISVIGSAVLKLVFGIEGLMALSWWECLMMLAISVLLSMFAGFIPSRIAANKDPAIALRSE